jgi:hypothetical protein
MPSRLEVRVLDPLDTIRIFLGSTAVYQLAKAFRTVWVERSKRKTLLAVMDRMIALEPGQVERLRPRLEGVRSQPDEMQPPAAS